MQYFKYLCSFLDTGQNAEWLRFLAHPAYAAHVLTKQWKGLLLHLRQVDMALVKRDPIWRRNDQTKSTYLLHVPRTFDQTEVCFCTVVWVDNAHLLKKPRTHRGWALDIVSIVNVTAMAHDTSVNDTVETTRSKRLTTVSRRLHLIIESTLIQYTDIRLRPTILHCFLYLFDTWYYLIIRWYAIDYTFILTSGTRLPAGALPGSNSAGQVVHTHVPLSPSTGQGAVIKNHQIKIYIAPYVHEDSEALGEWITCSRRVGIDEFF